MVKSHSTMMKAATNGVANVENAPAPRLTSPARIVASTQAM